MTSSLNLTQSQSLVRQGPFQVCAISSLVECKLGFPGGVVVEKLPSNAGDTRDAGLIPGSGRTMEKELAAHSSILVGKFHGQRSLMGYSPWGHKELETTKRAYTHTHIDCEM